MSNNIRIAIYARVSDKAKGQEYENQLLQLREFLIRKQSDDWLLVKEYLDDVSGGKATHLRPKFKLMLEDASRKEFDVLLFWSLDRFSREGVLETLQHLDKLNRYGVGWYSYTEQYLRTDKHNDFIKDITLSILAAIAKQERVRIQERVLAGMARVKANGGRTRSGKAVGRPRKVVDSVQILEDRANGKTVSEIAKKYNVGLMTIHRVLRKCKDKDNAEIVRNVIQTT